MREKKITRRLWYQFTEAEERAVGQELSGAIDRARDARERKRDVVKAMNEEIAGIEEEITAMAVKLKAHGENRETECKVVFHRPVVGTKQIFREDNGDLVAKEPMTPEECQEHLFEAGAGA
ncbi:MAG: hypothetical protein NVS9B14_21520 [Candidatus Acidiferrum sp.]